MRPSLELRFAFTQRDTPALRRRIESDLTRIVERVRECDPHLDALVLTGGFSRGEGTALDDAPVNDYDLLAIRMRPGGGPIPSLSLSLSQELGIEVDVLPVWRERLPFVGRKLFWLDARLGARVIWGDPRALATLRSFGDVAPREIARLLGNRAAGLLLALPAPGDAPDDVQRDLQATKAILAVMDATLLHQGRYAPTLRARLALTRDHPDHATFARAVAWKLAPSPTPEGWWEAARDALLRAVDATHARAHRDGLVEHVFHAAKALRLAASPSQAVRSRAWELLAQSRWPIGPPVPAWTSVKRDFFHARARTLQ